MTATWNVGSTTVMVAAKFGGHTIAAATTSATVQPNIILTNQNCGEPMCKYKVAVIVIASRTPKLDDTKFLNNQNSANFNAIQ